MTVYRSASKAGAHRRIGRLEKLIDWFRVVLFETEYPR